MINARYPVVAIDAMSGDFGPKVTIPAALMALKNHDNLTVILVGDASCIEAHLNTPLSQLEARCFIQPVSQDERSSEPCLHKAEASMQVALNLLNQKKANACITAGHTRALIERAHATLNRLPGIHQVALSVTVPTLQPHQNVRLLDLGAHLTTEVEHLLQYTKMGIALLQAVDQVPSPTVGLLDTGQTDTPISQVLHKAHQQLLKQTKSLNYVGYISFDALLNSNVDLIILDGSTGHIASQVIETTLKGAHTYFKQSLSQSGLTKFASSLLKPFVSQIEKRFNANDYNGATLVGYEGTVIKSHEKAHQEAFYYAIKKAIHEVEQAVPERIQSMNQLF